MDAQIRGAQPLDGTHSGRRVTADSRVAGGDGATGVIRVDVAVPAAAPAIAQPLFEALLAAARAQHQPVACGRFGADMQVSLVNDGPVTFWLES